jgi:diguanylate cyclase (GGDEF)-like protein/PAS domain S-box-containing protein
LDGGVRTVADQRGHGSLDLATIAGLLPDAVIVIDSLARIVWANTAAERMFVLPLDSVVGANGLDFIHPDDFQLAALSISSVQSKEVGTLIELRVRAGETWRLVELLGSPIEDDLILLNIRDLTERRRWEVAGDENARFRTIIQNAASLLLLVSADGLVIASSGAVTRLLGHDQERLEQRPFSELVDDDDQTPQIGDRLRGMWPASGAHGSVTIDVRLRHALGIAVPFALTFVNLLDDPTVQAIVVTGHDVTDRLVAEEELRRANSLLSATLESATDGIIVVDLIGRITTFNDKFVELWGIDPLLLRSCGHNQVISLVLHQLCDPGGFAAKVHELDADPELESHDTIEFRDGRVVERDSVPQRINGRVVGRVASFRDVTENRRLAKELAHQAFHDRLTGLANRALFRDRVEQAVAKQLDSEGELAILFIDLDNFKTVNDSLGHLVGDSLLVAVSARFPKLIRPGDSVARLGGDEFAILVDGFVDRASVHEIAERIILEFQQPFLVEGRDVTATASIGIAFGSSGTSADELLRSADLAMYNAKASGKNCFRVFTPEMHLVALRRLALEEDLRGALTRGEFVVHYQPIFGLGSGRIHGFEALVRWQHPERGLLLPAEFLAMTEESRLIDEIGAVVLATACDQAAVWQPLGGDLALTMAVNISPGQLLDADFPGEVASVLVRSGLPNGCLTLEITERALMSEPLAAARSLKRIRRLGVHIAVDDFGTGYSSLAYLQQFAVDRLKIDRSFVVDMLTPAGLKMAGAIIHLSRTLGIVPIAEGVESQSQADALRGLGCELAQGFHLQRPLDAAGAFALLTANAQNCPA